MAQKFDKFTENARKVFEAAQKEARRLDHNYLGTEHLLLGLVSVSEGVAAKVLGSLGVDVSKVRSAVEFIIGRGDARGVGEIGLSPRAEKVIRLAVQEAGRFRHHYIGTEHLLLGLVLEGEGMAASVLESLGVNLDRTRAEVVRILSGSIPRGTPTAAFGQTKGVVEMPIIRVEMWPGRTHAQKQELARVLTEAMCNIANTTPEATIVVFQDVAKEDWAQGGRLASDDDE